MRFRKQVGNAVLGMALLAAVAGSAFAKNSGQLELRKAVTVNGVSLAPGHYKVSWQTHSPEATVTFQPHKGASAIAEGKVEERPTRYDDDAVVFENNPDGSFKIIEIRFAGSNKVLTFGESSPSSKLNVPKPETAWATATRPAKALGSAPALRRANQQGFAVDPVLMQLLYQSRSAQFPTTARQPIKQ